MHRFWRWFLIPAAALMFYGASCGGGGGSGDPNATANAGDLLGNYTAAMEALKGGRIQEAHDLFAAAIGAGQAQGIVKADVDLNSILTKSHAGRAVTQILLLQESAPITAILDGFGQSPWYLNSVYGATGYLAQQSAIHGATSVDLHVSGAVEKDVVRSFARTWLATWSTFYASQSHHRTIRYRDDNGEDIYLYLSLATATTPLGGTTSESECVYGAGAVLTPATACTLKTGSSTEVILYPLSALAYYDYIIDPARSTGSVTINELGTQVGERTSVTFDNVTLYKYDSSVVTLNGTLTDTISDTAGATLDGFPFRTSKSVSRAMYGVMPSYTSATAIASLLEIGGLFDLILDDLAKAATDTAATFDLPKELLFSDRDLHLNHTDIVAMQAAFLFGRAAIHLAGSWTADVGLSGLYDDKGTFIGNKTQLVHALNQSFLLRSDHQLLDARDRMTEAFAVAAQAFTEATADSSGTVLVIDDANRQLYAEIAETMASASNSMGGPQAITGLDPQLTVDLTRVFEGQVDGAQVQSDPFVLEGSNIKLVESYFTTLMKDVCDYDLTTHPDVKAFSDAVRALQHVWIRTAFPAFMKSRVGGLPFRSI